VVSALVRHVEVGFEEFSRLWSEHMRRNIAGLKRSARLRSEQAMERALAALHRMDASDRDINFLHDILSRQTLANEQFAELLVVTLSLQHE
jgi:hypothetical protein